MIFQSAPTSLVFMQFIMLLVALCISKLSCFTIIKTNNGSIDVMYMLVNGWAKEIHHNDTVEYFGFKPENLHFISWDILSEFKRGAVVPLVKQSGGTPDEIMRLELLKVSILQPGLIYDLRYVGEYINPSIVKFKNRYLLVSGLAWGFAGLNAKSSNEMLEFAWVNTTRFPIDSSTDLYHGVSMQLNPLPSGGIPGQDPRLVVMSEDRLLLFYTNRFGKLLRMGVAEVVLDSVSGNLTTTKVHMTINPDQDHRSDQKNWSPFVYNNSVLLIQRLNPMHVVSYEESADGGMHASTVSQVDHAPFHWPYGELRGGTNAVLVKGRGEGEDEDVYLSLFHSRAILPGNSLTTYFFGAYTFSAKPPFHLLAASPYPIMNDQLYTGEWNPLKNRHIDYVCFPMTIEQEGGELTLSFGRQDHQGWLGTMNTQQVLESLRPIGSDRDKKAGSGVEKIEGAVKSRTLRGGEGRKRNRK